MGVLTISRVSIIAPLIQGEKKLFIEKNNLNDK
jgi:hypothetical protein